MIVVPDLGLQELDIVLRDTIIHDKRHRYYKRTVELASLYKKFMTGESQDELLVIYKPRENDDQKKRRMSLTNSATKHICHKVYNQFCEVDRVDNIVDNIFYDTESKKTDTAIREIHDRLQVFHKNEPIKKYLDEAFKHLTFYDPNSWIVVELHNQNPDKEKPYTYPVEVYSEQAINYHKVNGLLQWIVVMHEKTIFNKAEPDEKTQPTPQSGAIAKKIPEVGYRYTIYGSNDAIVLDEIGKLDPVPLGAIIVDLKMKDGKTRTFIQKTFSHKSEKVPAVCVGYLPDAETNRETYVGILDKASLVLKDIIRSKSEYDLANALHGYSKMYALTDACDYKDDAGNKCKNGQYSTGETCRKCNGTGLQLHSSVQDVVLVKRSETKEEHIPLSEQIYYVPIDQTLIDRHKADVEKYEKDVARAIFNVNVFDRSEIAVTATEKKLDMRNIYNVFSAYAAQWSSIYKHCVYITAVHLELQRGLIIEHKFPSDFKMDSIDELILQRKAAKDAGSPYEVIRYIDLQILSKQNIDNSETVQMVESVEYWKPFKSKSDQERTYTISQLPPDDDNKILWMYWDQIWRQIELDEVGKKVGKEDSPGVPFHKKPKDMQWKLIKEQIDLLKANQIVNQVENATNPFQKGTLGKNKEKQGADNPDKKTDPNSTDSVLLNGAQIQSALEIITQLSTGQIPRDSAKQMLIEFLGIDSNTAERILGNIGKGFKPKVGNTNA